MRALAVLVLSFSVAQAQPVDKERVRQALAFYGYTCADLQRMSRIKLAALATAALLDAEQRRQVKVTCNIK